MKNDAVTGIQVWFGVCAFVLGLTTFMVSGGMFPVLMIAVGVGFISLGIGKG